jgi:hypothetical protein
VPAFALGPRARLRRADPRTEPNCPPPPPEPPSVAQLQAAQPEARDHGLLWRIQKQGHVPYLFGTIDVGKWSWSLPGPQLRRALAQTDLLALPMLRGQHGFEVERVEFE